MPDHPDLPHVSQVILDRWDRLKPAVREYFLAHNEKEAKRLEAKEAAGAAQKAASSERKADEKTRSVFARRLYKWLDRGGQKLPSDEEGIRHHQAMVAEYEEQYGPVKTDYQRIYDRIRAAAEVERKRQEDNARIFREAEERRERQKREVAMRRAKRFAERFAERAKRTALRSIPVNERRVSRYSLFIDRLNAHIERDGVRLADLMPKLDTEEYESERHSRALLKVINTVTKRLKWRVERRHYYQEKLDAAKQQIVFARQKLEGLRSA